MNKIGSTYAIMNITTSKEICDPSSTSDEDRSEHLLPLDWLQIGQRQAESERGNENKVVPLVGQRSGIPAIGICTNAVDLTAVDGVEVVIAVGTVGDGEAVKFKSTPQYGLHFGKETDYTCENSRSAEEGRGSVGD